MRYKSFKAIHSFYQPKGFSILELMIVTALLGLFTLLFAGTLLNVQRAYLNETQKVDSAIERHLAMLRIFRDLSRGSYSLGMIQKKADLINGVQLEFFNFYKDNSLLSNKERILTLDSNNENFFVLKATDEVIRLDLNALFTASQTRVEASQPGSTQSFTFNEQGIKSQIPSDLWGEGKLFLFYTPAYLRKDPIDFATPLRFPAFLGKGSSDDSIAKVNVDFFDFSIPVPGFLSSDPEHVKYDSIEEFIKKSPLLGEGHHFVLAKPVSLIIYNFQIDAQNNKALYRCEGGAELLNSTNTPNTLKNCGKTCSDSDNEICGELLLSHLDRVIFKRESVSEAYISVEAQ